MSMQDIVSDFVARVNNALSIGSKEVRVIRSTFVRSIVQKMVSAGYFDSFKEDKYEIIIQLNNLKLQRLIRLSKPGKRQYVGKNVHLPIRNGYGNNFISTSQGILTAKECIQKKVGGEALLQAVRPYLTRKTK